MNPLHALTAGSLAMIASTYLLTTVAMIRSGPRLDTSTRLATLAKVGIVANVFLPLPGYTASVYLSTALDALVGVSSVGALPMLTGLPAAMMCVVASAQTSRVARRLASALSRSHSVRAATSTYRPSD